MRITKVYTRTGDDGMTRLAGGQDVAKDVVRVEAYGTVDECNAVLGVARASLREMPEAGDRDRVDGVLEWMQHKLFDLGGLLSTAPGQTFQNMPTVTAEDVATLERFIDAWHADVPPLQEFVLPGGGTATAVLHHARTVCRRAERLCVSLKRIEQVDADLLKFLNRLSDALFVLARWVGHRCRETECVWRRDAAAPEWAP